jgi:transcription initiation factor TFIIIB Brf1 subunit/transcription initiation factor TFIIB
VSIFVRNEKQNEEMMTFWVHSLTFLRKELFQFQDRLSFERSTFLVPGMNPSPLIRIKSIRGFVTIPQRACEQEDSPPVRKQRSREKINELLNHNIQHLIMFLNRETGQTMQESIVELRNYVIDYCTELNLKFQI